MNYFTNYFTFVIKLSFISKFGIIIDTNHFYFLFLSKKRIAHFVSYELNMLFLIEYVNDGMFTKNKLI